MAGITITAILAAFVSYVLYLFVRSTSSCAPANCKPPPKLRPLDPIFGLDNRIKIALDGQNWLRWHAKYGHTYTISPLIGDLQINTAHPDNMYEILTGKDFTVEWRREGLLELLGIGFLTMDGEEWSKAKKMLKPCFAKKNIDNMEFTGAVIDALIAKIPTGGETVDIFPLLQSTFTDTALNFVLGVDSRKQDEGVPVTLQDFPGLWQSGLLGMGLRMVLGRIMKYFPGKGYSRLCGRIHSFIEFYIDKYSQNQLDKSNSWPQCAADVLSGISDNKIYVRSQLLQTLTGAQDTTMTLTCNTIELLARNQSVWEELKAHVREKGESMMCFDNLRGDSLVQDILKESLRLRPVLAALARGSARDTTLPFGGGPDGQSPTFVPKGSLAVANFYVLHQNPAVFGEDVSSFNPLRWKHIQPSPREYIPFGIGGRSCLGKDKALMEAAYVIVKLAREFDVLECRDTKPYRASVSLTMKNANGCKVAFSKRA